MERPITRRTFVQATTGSLALPVGLSAGCGAPEASSPPVPDEAVAAPREPEAARQPVLFVSHGAPDLAIDPVRGAGLRALGEALPSAAAALVLSAHWEDTPVRLGAVEPRELIHDYGGFDPSLREVRHDAPAAPELARRAAHVLGVEHDPVPRGWDHGVWVPLVHLDPAAGLPVLQLSLPTRLTGPELVALGRRLAPLRDEGVLILGSGGLVHNLGRMDRTERAPTPGWASDFEEWARAALIAHDVDELAGFRERAPALREAHPTLEHLQPLLVALGAADDSDAVSFPVAGFEYSSLSRTTVRFG